MQPVSAQGAALLASAVRAPAVYIWAQLPVIVNQYGNIDAQKLGSQIILNNVTKFSCTNVLDIGADKMDFELQGTTWDYSPLTANSNFVVNLAPNADNLSGWTFGSATISTGGPNGATDWEYTGKGSTAGVIISQAPSFVSVTPGNSYVLSAWCDPTYITSGTSRLRLVSTDLIENISSVDCSSGNSIGRYATNAWTCPINLAPNSDSMTGWGPQNGGTMGTGGPNGAVDYEYTGTGSATGTFPGINYTVSVIPGQTYVQSYWLDPSNVTNFGSNVIYNTFGDVNHTADILDTWITSSASGRYSSGAWTCPTNLAPNSDSLGTGWSVGLDWSITTDGPNGANSFTAVGTGSTFTPGRYVCNYRGIPCSTNTNYTFSAYVDPSHITSGNVYLRIWDSTGNSLLGSTAIPSGSKGWYHVTGNSGNFTSLLIDCALDGSTIVANGQKLTVSQPMLVQSSSPVNYYISSQNPRVRISCQLNNAAIVANGQKFKISQPMLEQASSASGYYISSQTPQVGIMFGTTATCVVASGNLLSDSSTMATWNNLGGTLNTGGPGGAADWEYTGTGSAAGAQQIQSTATTVTPGQSIVLSGWVDYSAGYTGSTPRLLIYDVTHSAEIASVVPPSGATGRYSCTVTVPAGCTSVKAIADVQNATVPSGQKLKYSQLMLEVGTVASSTYKSGRSVLKYSQPMLEVGSAASGYYVSPSTPAPVSGSKYGRYFAAGAVDIKYQAWLGLAKDGSSTLWSKGVYVSEAVNQQAADGLTTFSVNTLDQFSLFQGDAYAEFPPRLYGAQNSGYYNPNYALTNPSGDLKTYASDTMYWMQANTQLPIWASDYVAVAVYSSAVSGGASPVPNSGSTAYTIDYNKGRVTFSTAQPANAVISVDARPLAMKPEIALYHLFVDYGDWDPNFIKFDQTGTAIPLIELARDRTIVDIAKDIVALIGPRGQRWALWIDENGYLRLSEQAKDGPPVATLVDTKDILKISPEYAVTSLQNVVRAKGQISSNQPIEVISYDIYSISTYGQKPTFDVPQQLVNMTKTMDAGSAMSYLNGICNSLLFEFCRPSLRTEIDVLPNPAYQVGDPLKIIESHTGINNTFRIMQIDNKVEGGDWQQTLTVEKQSFSQDWNYGISANLGTGQSTNANAIVVQSGFITDVSLNNSSSNPIHVVSNGQPLTDSSYQPYVFNWDGGPLTINITIGNLQASTTAYIWRWLYIAQDAYYNGNVITGNGSMLALGDRLSSLLLNDLWGLSGIPTLPYDVRANADTTISRKYWWPLMRCSDWLTNDGVTGYTTTTTLTSTWSGGPGVSGNWQCYGNLVVGKNDFFGDQTTGFVGQQLWAAGTPGANALGTSSTIKYGVDFGRTLVSTPISYGIKDKQTPAYLNILVATTGGTMQYKKIPLMLSL